VKDQGTVRKAGPRRVIEEVTAVYRELADRPIERDCQARTTCCRFRLTGEVPFVTRGEAILAARAWRATGRRELPSEKESQGHCPLLDLESGKCRIYQSRPFPCRTHFCSAAGGPYRRSEVIDLIRKLEEIGRSQGGEVSSRPLRAAVTAELKLLQQNR
jgi:uncharacterized protein